MITACLDTNVLVSGFAGSASLSSVPGEVIRRWEAGQYQLITSEPILEEVARTLQKPYFLAVLTTAEIDQATEALRRRSLVTPITAQVSGVATHPEDDLILATAVSAPADYLVTGDGQLQRLERYQQVTILTPRAFLNLLDQQPPPPPPPEED